VKGQLFNYLKMLLNVHALVTSNNCLVQYKKDFLYYKRVQKLKRVDISINFTFRSLRSFFNKFISLTVVSLVVKSPMGIILFLSYITGPLVKCFSFRRCKISKSQSSICDKCITSEGKQFLLEKQHSMLCVHFNINKC
jgi:hypothetical protein